MISLILMFLTLEIPSADLEHPAGNRSAEASFHVFDDKLYMSWIETDGPKSGRLLFAVYDGATWTKPVLAHQSDALFINWADFPKLCVTDDMMMIAWPQMLGKGTYDYGLYYRLSQDGGKTWDEARLLHEDTSKAEHGFVSLAALGPKKIGALWLDGRAMKGDHGHDHGSGSMQLRYREVGSDGMGPEMLIDDRTCECCSTDLVVLNGKPTASWRDRSMDEVRDVWVSHLKEDGWLQGAPIANDNWKIHGCPVNGPALSARGSKLAVAWFTAGSEPLVQVKLSGDGGNTFSRHEKFAKDVIGRVDIAWIDDQRVALTWLSSTGSSDQVNLAVVDANGGIQSFPPIAQNRSGRSGGVPRLAVLKDQLIIAHADPSKDRIMLKKVAVASLKSAN